MGVDFSGRRVSARGVSSAGYQIVLTDMLIVCDTSGNDVTVVMPDATPAADKDGHVYHIKKQFSQGTLTVEAWPGQQIDDDPSIIINSQDSVVLIAYAGGWFIV